MAAGFRGVFGRWFGGNAGAGAKQAGFRGPFGWFRTGLQARAGQKTYSGAVGSESASGTDAAAEFSAPEPQQPQPGGAVFRLPVPQRGKSLSGSSASQAASSSAGAALYRAKARTFTGSVRSASVSGTEARGAIDNSKPQQAAEEDELLLLLLS